MELRIRYLAMAQALAHPSCRDCARMSRDSTLSPPACQGNANRVDAAWRAPSGGRGWPRIQPPKPQPRPACRPLVPAKLILPPGHSHPASR
jgi:hypothetical protein